ncbi:exported hypothetical protein [Burkholderia cepacia]|nr:exported hypothetical protein [Burkholderia cepacia]
MDAAGARRCSARICSICVRSICLTGTCMSLVTSPLSAVVTGNAVELICCPGTTVHAESTATVVQASAMHMPRMAVREWPGATESNGRTFFIFCVQHR